MTRSEAAREFRVMYIGPNERVARSADAKDCQRPLRSQDAKPDDGIGLGGCLLQNMRIGTMKEYPH